MRYHRGNDPWGRGSYPIPQYAVAGSSDCGTAADSPAPSDRVREELAELRTFLRKSGIRSRLRGTQSGNVCMRKRWLVVHSRDYAEAKAFADEWLEDHRSTTSYIHDAI